MIFVHYYNILNIGETAKLKLYFSNIILTKLYLEQTRLTSEKIITIPVVKQITNRQDFNLLTRPKIE